MYIYELLFTDGKVTREGLLNVLAFVVALFLSLILHEIAHGLVALWNGDDTAKLAGRLSLNPMRHMDLYGMLLMLLVGFGWAKPVPINPNNFKNRKRGMITVSLAGVITNLLLAFVFSLAFYLIATRQGTAVNSTGDEWQHYLWYFLWALSRLMLSINVSLALFNILPLFPLDGYRFLSCFISQDNGFMRFLRKYSFFIIIGSLLISYLPVVGSYAPISLFVGGVGNAIINLFINLWRLLF